MNGVCLRASARESDRAEWSEPKMLTPKRKAKLLSRYHQLANGCWQWDGNKTSGYGRIMVGRRHIKAHRFFYESLVGPIPDGMVIDHLCRNHSCVNPDHLEVVTTKENILRGMSTGAIAKRTNRCKYGHSLDRHYVGTKGNRICALCSIRNSVARNRRISAAQNRTEPPCSTSS